MEGTMSSLRLPPRALAGLTAVLLFSAFAAETTPAQPHPARDWKGHPAVVSASPRKTFTPSAMRTEISSTSSE